MIQHGVFGVQTPSAARVIKVTDKHNTNVERVEVTMTIEYTDGSLDYFEETNRWDRAPRPAVGDGEELF